MQSDVTITLSGQFTALAFVNFRVADHDKLSISDQYRKPPSEGGKTLFRVRAERRNLDTQPSTFLSVPGSLAHRRKAETGSALQIPQSNPRVLHVVRSLALLLGVQKSVRQGSLARGTSVAMQRRYTHACH